MMRALVVAALLQVAAIVSVASQSAPRTVWDGAFTPEQAERGRTFYAAQCATCHGSGLEGGDGRALAGPAFWSVWSEQSVSDLLAYVSKNMPMGGQVGSLSPAVYADIVAHVLNANDLPAGNMELNAGSSAGVRIVPKGGGSGELPASTLARVTGCLAPQAADRSWRVVKATRPVRANAAADTPTAAGAGDREFTLKFVLQPLTALVGQQVMVEGLLLGEGGTDGINVTTVTGNGRRCD
jgi:S-disulfanyl-L-cysteine oxidoreductase SoxD